MNIETYLFLLSLFLLLFALWCGLTMMVIRGILIKIERLDEILAQHLANDPDYEKIQK